MTENALMVMSENDFISLIHQEDDIKQMLAKIKVIVKLEDTLKAMNLFHQRATWYAQLEAEALLRAVDLGGVEKLSKKLIPVAKWLHGMGDAQRTHYIRMCADGLTIDQVYKKEVGDKIEYEEKSKLASSLRKRLVDELNTKGETDMSEYVHTMYSLFKSEDATDKIDGTRNALRVAGGISPGNDSHEYLKVTSSGNEEGIKNGVRYRIKKINDCFMSIVNILDKSGVKLRYEEILGELSGYSDEKTFLKNPFWMHMIIALSEYGAFSNESEIHDAISNDEGSEMYKLFADYPSFAQFIEEAYKALCELRSHGKVA